MTLQHSGRAAPTPRPMVWSVAGHDSGGGAGLSADQRAADSAGVHLCPVLACITAQNSVEVQRLSPVPPEILESQFQALERDLPPDAIKTGLIGSAEGVRALVSVIDRLRGARPHLPVVVDPVLKSSTGANFADDALLQAYVQDLLPRTTVLTPNRTEARRLVVAAGLTDADEVRTWPVSRLASALRRLGVRHVVVTGGDREAGACHADDTLARDWLDCAPPVPGAAQVQGWMALRRIDTHHHHGTGCTHSTWLASAMAWGHGGPDAAVIAKMGTAAALSGGWAAGSGCGPVGASRNALCNPAWLPALTWGDDAESLDQAFAPAALAPFSQGLYGLADDAASLVRGLRSLQDCDAPIAAMQLRIKREAHAHRSEDAFREHVQAQIREAAPVTAKAGVPLYLNDHWHVLRQALKNGALSGQNTARLGLHLGQEDLSALGPAGRQELQALRRQHGLQLGISSHSLWELCRARTQAPTYVACGPIWPTTTKDMPWLPQGLDNLSWWSRMSPHPVVAIGGLLDAPQFAGCRQAGAHAACLVRALQSPDTRQLLTLTQAWTSIPPPLDLTDGPSPHPCLPEGF